MSEVDVQQPEIVTDVDQNRKYIEDFIDQIQSDNFAKAETNFKDMVGGRLGDMLDQQKAKLAGQIFTDVEPEISSEVSDEEPEEVDLTPDDFEDDEETN